MLPNVTFTMLQGCEDCVQEEGDNRLSPSSTSVEMHSLAEAA